MEEGDTVAVSHLLRENPIVTGVERNENTIVVTMETSRGGRHRPIVLIDGQGRLQESKARLRRYRGAKDDRWMANSDTPYHLRILEEET